MKYFLSAAVGLLLGFGASAQNFALSTNVLDYINLGTINMEASYGIARQWTVSAGLKYNPFSYGSGNGEFADRQRSLDAGARYWPWHIYSGWWMAGKLKWQEYSTGGFTGTETSEGDRFGGSLGAGYTFMLNSHLNLDIGMGLWGGYDIYTAYACQHCGKVTDSGEKFFVLPNDILLTISYIF